MLSVLLLIFYTKHANIRFNVIIILRINETLSLKLIIECRVHKSCKPLFISYLEPAMALLGCSLFLIILVLVFFFPKQLQRPVTYTYSINMHKCWLDLCAAASSTRLIIIKFRSLTSVLNMGMTSITPSPTLCWSIPSQLKHSFVIEVNLHKHREIIKTCSSWRYYKLAGRTVIPKMCLSLL